MNEIIVVKFGGSSLATAAGFNSAADVILEHSAVTKVFCVVSAVGGSTNVLEEDVVGSLARKRDVLAPTALLKVVDTCLSLGATLLAGHELRRYQQTAGEELSNVLPSLRRLKAGLGSASDEATILAIGELLSAPLLAAVLRERGLVSRAHDAVPLIRVASGAADDRVVEIDAGETRERVEKWAGRLGPGEVPVITGFIASDAAGCITTLGRGGSDLTAAIVAATVGADRLERWTDVNGLYCSDPDQNPDAVQIPEINMESAIHLNRSSRLGMHRQALDPLVGSRTAVHVRSFRIPGDGTVITPGGCPAAQH